MKTNKLEEIKYFLKYYDGPDMNIMEVCGSHTRAIAENGIPGMLSERIHLLSGPGCPVCVAPSSYIDRLIELALEPKTVVAAFGDLIRVPGSERSLSEAKGEGAKVEMLYSPLDMLELATQNPDRLYVFAAVGFETTTPVFAELLHRAEEEGVENIRLLTAIKTMPPVIQYLMEADAPIDGFLAPGHVSVITGSDAFLPLAKRYDIPFVVSGFSGERLLLALYDLVSCRGRGVVRNDYPSVVSAEGNLAAKAEVNRYFETATAVWRGMGAIPNSGLILKEKYKKYDAGSETLTEDERKNKACICHEILAGKKKPFECALFGKICTPLQPQGACMVSQEGSCFSYYSHQRER